MKTRAHSGFWLRSGRRRAPVGALAALLLLLSPARPAAGAATAAPRLEKVDVSAETADAPFRRIAEAVALTLDHLFAGGCGPASDDAPPCRVEVAVEESGEGVEVKITLDHGGEAPMAAAVSGDLPEAASWLGTLGEALSAGAPRGEQKRLSPGGATVSTEALESFLEAASAPSPEAREELLAAALRYDPGFASARWQLAVLRYLSGRLGEALEDFISYGELAGEGPRSLHNEGLCLFRLGRKEEAAEKLRRAVSGADYHGGRRYLAGILALSGDLAAAAGELEESLRSGGPGEDYAAFALLKRRLGDVEGARRGLSELPGGEAASARSFLLSSAEGFFGRGDLDSASGAFELALVLEPSDFRTLLSLAVVRYSAGDYEGAVQDLTAAAGLGGEDPDIFRYLGMSHEMLGNTAEAMENFRKSTKFQAADEGEGILRRLFLSSLAESDGAEDLPPLFLAPYARVFSLSWLPPSPGATGAAGVLPPGSPGQEPGERAAGPGTSPPLSGPGGETPASWGEGEEKLREQVRSLAEALRQKEEQAMVLAEEALAAQKGRREREAEVLSLREELDRLSREAAPGEVPAAEELEELKGQREALADRVRELESALEEMKRNVDNGLEEKELLVRELDELRRGEQGIEEELGRRRGENEELAAALAEAEGERAELKALLGEKERRDAETGEEVEALAGEVRDLRQAKADSDSRGEELAGEASRRQERIGALEEELGRRRGENEELAAALAEAEGERAELKALLGEKERRDAETEKELKQAWEGLEEKLDAARQEREGERRELEGRLEECRRGTERLESELGDDRRRAEALGEELAGCRETAGSLEGLERLLEDLNEERAMLLATVADLEGLMAEHGEEVKALSDELERRGVEVRDLTAAGEQTRGLALELERKADGQESIKRKLAQRLRETAAEAAFLRERIAELERRVRETPSSP